jgi:hypothetical protein
MYLPPTTDLKEIQNRAERDEIYLYFLGLDSSYEIIRSHILLLADLPSLKIVVTMTQGSEVWPVHKLKIMRSTRHMLYH